VKFTYFAFCRHFGHVGVKSLSIISDHINAIVEVVIADVCGGDVYVDAQIGDGNATMLAPQHPKQLTISYDLYRAIEDLRSVPVLRWPDEVTFDDNFTCGVVDRTECNAVTNASVSGNIVQSEISNHTTKTTTSMKVSTISTQWSYTVQTDDYNVEHPSAIVDGDLTSTSSSEPLVDWPDWTVNKHIHEGAHHVEEQTSASDAGNERVSDNVFADVAMPIDADLLIDDVYEREMDELDQLDIEVSAFDDPRDWLDLPPRSTATYGFAQGVHHIYEGSTDIQTDRLLVNSFTDRRLIHSICYTTERNFIPASSSVEVHRAEVHPQSVRVDTSSSVACRSTDVPCIDTSAEELFEQIVESMTDTVAEDDAELDAFTDEENQLLIDATNTKTGAGKLETIVGRRNFVTEKFVDDNVVSPKQPFTWPSNRHSGRNDMPNTLEQKRQKNLTVCLASTLSECLNALSPIDANARRIDNVRHDTTSVGRYLNHDITNSDAMCSSSSTKSSRPNSLGRQCITSSSSGFQSDLIEVDIDEEFDANVPFDAADLGTLRSAADSTSLDSLLETNDDDDDDDVLYSDQTIVRRPIPLSRRSDNHSITNNFVKPTTSTQTTVITDRYVTAVDRTESLDDKDDGTDKKNGTVVAYDEQSAKVEVLAEELITQEIVLNIVLPRRSKENKKRAEVNGCMDRWEATGSGVIDRRKSDKAPHRDFHIHRVVRCSDAADRSDDRLAIAVYPESKRQKSITDAVENGSAMNEDDKQLDLSSVVVPCSSLLSRCVGGPLSIEVERDSGSTTTEQVDDDVRLHVTRRNRVKVLRAPDGSGAALLNAPVTSINDVVDDVGRTLVGDDQRQLLRSGARVTCDAIERKSSTSLPDGDVTVLHRTIVDDRTSY